MSEAAAAYFHFKKNGGIADLSDRTKIRLTGADRVRFLNGQVTANVNRVTERESLRACVTTAKGKLCADVFISAERAEPSATSHAGLMVDAEPELREALLARLERYIIADDVALEDLTDSVGLIHFLPAPEAGIESLHDASFSPFPPVRARRFGRDGFDFFLPPESASSVVATLCKQHTVLDKPLLELLRIEAGVPRWGRELNEDTLPPEAGLDHTHIDFHKGCYIGQEVISRIRSVGHVNRTLAGFVAHSSVPPATPATLFAHDAADAPPIGQLTSAAWSFALEMPIALGYLKRGSPLCDMIARPAQPAGAEVVVSTHTLPFVS